MIATLLACHAPPEVRGACDVSAEDPLRATCTFTVEPPGPVTVTARGPDGDEVVRAGASGEALRLWRLRPDAAYTVTAVAGGGEGTATFHTGPVPGWAEVDVIHDGEPVPDDLLFVTGCAGGPAAVVLSPEGEVVWAQRLAEGLPGERHDAVGLSVTEDGTALAVVDGRVREWSADGALLGEWVPEDPDQLAHHDAVRRDGVTYALRARRQLVDGVEVMVDGVLAFDADGPLWDWDLASLAEPTNGGAFGDLYWLVRFPDAVDWAHANGLEVLPDGDFVVSTHTFSTVLRIEGDPDDPAFGAPVWALTTQPDGPFGADLDVADPRDLTPDDSFGHQHHPSFPSPGVLRLFDNGDALGDPARVLELAVTDDGAEIVGSWPLRSRAGAARTCPIEGGAFDLSTGDLVASCAVELSFDVIARGGGETRSSTRVQCRAPVGVQLLPRPIPVELSTGLSAVTVRPEG